jgi:endonuclease III
MPTRAAAKREAEFLQDSGVGTPSSPPPTPTLTKGKNAAKELSGDVQNGAGVSTGEQQPSPAPGASAKRKRAAIKSKKTAEPVTGGWDVLPHGLGKKGDLVEGEASGRENGTDTPVPPPKKRARRGKAVKDATNEDKAILEVDGIKIEDQANDNDAKPIQPKEEGKKDRDIKVEVASKSKGSRGRARKTDPITPESSGDSVDPVTTELLEENQPKKRGRTTKSVKAEDQDADVKDEDFEDDEPKKKRTQRKKKVIDTSEEVLDKVDDLIDALGKVPEKERKKKANKYGLTPGSSPFPGFAMPTPEACEEVTRLLSELHGEVKPPEVIPPPSMEVTGCGEVPDLLDAILRTLLSASTTANNSNMALKGLKDKFGLRTSGVGEGSVNWEAVHKADLPTVIESIKKGGLAKVKGTNIKKILDAVYEQNGKRRDALLKEKEAGESADIPGAKRETQEQKDLEITKVNENMLSMDHVFEMTTDEAMEEMTKLPGIGVKTASCVILFCMKRPSFAVDTHVWRHCKWLGWVPEKATRDQTFSHCEVRVPDHLKYPLHQLFLRHGKTCGRCRANTSAGTEEWASTICPIDHLVTRKEKKKIPGAEPAKVKVAGIKKARKRNKSKKDYDTDDEMEVEMSEDGVDEENEENEDDEEADDEE